MRPSRWAFFATSVLVSVLACSLDYSVGPMDGNDSGHPNADSGNPGDGSGGGGGSDTGTDAAVPPSCTKPLTCAGKSCCESQLVDGGRFDRDNNSEFSADISSFRLDVFEVTVGRFRAFVEAGQGLTSTAPAAGAGADPKITGSGWNTSWNGKLSATTADLKAAVACEVSMETWTPTAGSYELVPMNCVSWYEAFAFCIWDGGRLPTSAEWNYAAAGGNEQREYPWGSGIDTSKATYGCLNSCKTADLKPAGSKSPQGDGKWHQADLSGSLWEWTLDSSKTLLKPCIDCVNLSSTATDRVRRGGNVSSETVAEMRSDGASVTAGGDHYWSNGFRCARPPR